VPGAVNEAMFAANTALGAAIDKATEKSATEIRCDGLPSFGFEKVIRASRLGDVEKLYHVFENMNRHVSEKRYCPTLKIWLC
jgi:hypothetical protein